MAEDNRGREPDRLLIWRTLQERLAGELSRCFEGHKFTELVQRVFFLAAVHAVRRDYWMDDDDLMFALLSLDSGTASVLETAGTDIKALREACDANPYNAGSGDINSPNFWELVCTGPEVVTFVKRRGAPMVDTFSLACGLLDSVKVRSRQAELRDILGRLSWNSEPILSRMLALRQLDPHLEDVQFALTIDQGRIHFGHSGFLDGFRVESLGEAEPGLVVVKSSILRDSGLLERSAVDEFEHLINKADVSEYELQKFLEAHPEFLLGVEYKALHSQVALFREDAPNLRPDFFLEKVDSTFSDIVDLKKPNVRLAKHPRNRSGFVAAVYDAIHQLREYRDYFEDTNVRNDFYRRHGFRAYRPKVTVIIGRSSDYLSYVQRVRIEESLARQFSVMTYDDVLAQARRRQIALS